MEKELLVQVIEAIDAIHKVFGAPGDHGYDTPEGDALFSLYKIRYELQKAVNS